ncbi:MAG: sodium-translocating pyrophosphatase [Ardenticatenaceae bacterium]|nr:sodium-translocating pyrophosphatase [Ardenticatenaceae bacterium]
MDTLLNILSAQAQQSAGGGIPIFWWLGPIGALAALGAAYYFYSTMMEEEEGTESMIEIADAVRKGAMAYLSAQYRYIAIVFGVLFVVFLILSAVGAQQWQVSFAFITAGLASAGSGYIGMRTATNASARTANAASRSLDEGLRVAFRGGAVMGMGVVGMALLDLSIWFLILYGIGLDPQTITTIQLSAAVGASTVALFGRVGGGIYTKAADVGADLVGKVEAGIPEDDPRNPATIADNVGDNVGDVAGMGADLYESYLASILSAAALGVAGAVAVGANFGEQLRYLSTPVMIAGLGVLVSIGAIFFVRARDDSSMKDLMWALEGTVWAAAGVIALISYLFLDIMAGSAGSFANHAVWQIWLALVIGLAAGIGIGRVTEYFTSAEHKPTQGIAAKADTGPGTVIIDGLAVGMESTAIPVLIVVFASGFAFYITGGADRPLFGLFGVAMAAVGMLSTLGITLATDAYGPIADNAGGNAEMAGLDPSVRQRTDQLDALGNTTAATGKGFAIGSAALTGLALLASYVEQIRINLLSNGTTELGSFDVATMTLNDLVVAFGANPLNPMFLLGAFIGAMVAFYFCALTMSAVGRAANEMVEEVRRQFREIPGIMEGEAKPDYENCVAISTKSALREMIVPSLLAIVIPIIVGLLMGVAGTLGLLAGGLATAFSLAIMMANAGGAWDNAKKYIEEGNYGGKGSDPHKAAVVGDTVGDPFKDTSGPSLNILIKLMSMVSVVFAGAVALIGQGQGLIMMLLGG